MKNYKLLFFFFAIFIIGIVLFLWGCFNSIASLSTLGLALIPFGFIETINEGRKTKEKNLQNKSKDMGLEDIGFEDKKFLKEQIKKAKYSIYFIGLNLNSVFEFLDWEIKEMIMNNREKSAFVLRFYITRKYNSAFRHEQEGKENLELCKNSITKFKLLKEYAIKNKFIGEISLFEYRDIPYCSLILIDDRKAMWTPYLYTLDSEHNFRFIFKNVSNEENQFKYFKRHYELISKMEGNWTKLIDSNKDEIMNTL